MSDIFSGIASITKSVTDTLNSYEVRKISDKVQSYVMNFTEPEMKVRDATTEEAWGPTPDMMREIAGLTFQYDAFPEVMGMLWKRMLPPSPVAWRHTYKSLILLEYLLKNGCERVISNAREHVFEMRSLEHYKCVNERGKDEGVNVRFRVKSILSLLEDDESLRNERRKAKAAGKEDKYRGFSRDEMSMRGYSGSSYNNKSSNFSSNSSRFDSGSRYDRDSRFDMDSRYDKDNRFDDDDTSSSKREVTAFDFDAPSHREPSPELGIPVDSPKHTEDDDGFGDFVNSRSNRPASQNSQRSNQKIEYEPFDFDAFRASVPTCVFDPAIHTQPPPSGSSISNFDPFGTNSAAASKPVPVGSNDFDFMALGGSNSKPVINPPSGPSSPKPASGFLDADLFGPAPSNPAPANTIDNTFDFFNSAPAPVPAPAPAPAPVVAQTNPSNDMFDFLGFSTPTPAAPMNPAPMNSLPMMGMQSAPAPSSSMSASSSSSTVTGSSMATPNTAASNKPKSALWNDLSGSLDLDNLLSTKPKASVSMNEMKNRQGNLM